MSELCYVKECEKPSHANGLCGMHDRRQRLFGNPMVKTAAEPCTAKAFLLLALEETDDCVVWPRGSSGDSSYGHIHVGDHATSTHRLAHQLRNGPIPDRFSIDHLCRNRPCMNYRHLEAVTQAENLRRGREARGVGV
jgi:hypothetical protein